MDEEEVGRFECSKCGGRVVAVGPKARNYAGTGAFIGHCPWDCGAWITRAFRKVMPGRVRAFRADEWDSRALRA